MKISELISKLELVKNTDGDLEVAILDGFNGGGEPRTINLVSVQDIKDNDYETDDITTQEGRILSIGYGCY